MKLSIVIPARNEAQNIGQTLEAVTARLQREAIDYEIVVVDDGSTDGTGAVVDRISASDPGARLVSNDGLHGFGWAMRTGLDAFTGDAVCIFMADLSDDPDDLVQYFYILRDQADCAFGSRFMAGGHTYEYPRFKLVVNWLANALIRRLFGLAYNDVTNAFKGYRAHVIQGCRPFLSVHFNLTVELPLRTITRGYTYAVVPISWHNRRYGTSSLRIQEMGSRYLSTIFHVWLEKWLAEDERKDPRGKRS